MTEAAPSLADRYPWGTVESRTSDRTPVCLDVINGDQSIRGEAKVRNGGAGSVENETRGDRIQKNEGERERDQAGEDCEGERRRGERETEGRRTEKENAGVGKM
ncbi:hypothetical protein NDU88_010440, partial [Pleurodeles waltl]